MPFPQYHITEGQSGRGWVNQMSLYLVPLNFIRKPLKLMLCVMYLIPCGFPKRCN